MWLFFSSATTKTSTCMLASFVPWPSLGKLLDLDILVTVINGSLLCHGWVEDPFRIDFTLLQGMAARPAQLFVTRSYLSFLGRVRNKLGDLSNSNRLSLSVPY